MTTVTLDPFLRPIDVGEYVRLGGHHDGGYVLPTRLISLADGLLSMGLGSNWRFERTFHARMRVPVHAYDHTVTSRLFLRDWLANCVKWPMGHSSWAVVKRRAARWWDYQVFFHGPAVHYHEAITAAHVSTALRRITGQHLLVKMDIDGAEYEALPVLLTAHTRIAGIVLEVHDISSRRDAFEAVMQSALEQYTCVWVHANNFARPNADGSAECIELSLLRKDLVPASAKRWAALPHPLDEPNNPAVPDYRVVMRDLPRAERRAR